MSGAPPQRRCPPVSADAVPATSVPARSLSALGAGTRSPIRARRRRAGLRNSEICKKVKKVPKKCARHLTGLAPLITARYRTFRPLRACEHPATSTWPVSTPPAPVVSLSSVPVRDSQKTAISQPCLYLPHAYRKYSVYGWWDRWTQPKRCAKEEVWEGSGGAPVAARGRAASSSRSCDARCWSCADRRAITAACMARR